MEFKNWIIEESAKPKEYQGNKIVYVNSKKFRSSSLENQEFCTIAVHEDFPKSIKNNEIWIDDSIKKKEIPELLKGVSARLKMLSKKKDSEKAYEHGLKKEKEVRKNSPLSIKLKKYCVLNDSKGKINVYFVSGEAVRDRHKTDFSQGGHGYVYDWIPKLEIWLEEEEKDEAAFILAHEYAEMILMRDRKMSYENAHPIASKIEKELRETGFSKKDFSKLTANSHLLL